MADPAEVKKWFHEGPIEPINVLQLKIMPPQHREIYDLLKTIQQKSIELETLTEQFVAKSAPIMAELNANPESPLHKWAWIEYYQRSWPKWAEEYEAAMGKDKANEVRKSYKQKKIPYLRVRFIHSRPDGT